MYTITVRKTYAVISCTGYLKSWPPAKMGLAEDSDVDGDNTSLSCLVAIGKLQPPFMPQMVQDNNHMNINATEFLSRHSLDGRFTYVDQRCVLCVHVCLFYHLLGCNCTIMLLLIVVFLLIFPQKKWMLSTPQGEDIVFRTVFQSLIL